MCFWKHHAAGKGNKIGLATHRMYEGLKRQLLDIERMHGDVNKFLIIMFNNKLTEP